MKKKAIIVDMDGTICENVTGRPWYGKGAAEGMLEDRPYTDIINLIDSYAYKYDLQVIILTGRHKGEELEATKKWLDKNSFFYDKIYARDLNDYSKTVVYKERVYESEIKSNYDVIMVFEDEDACVQMFRDKGLIVLQPRITNG